MCTAATYRTRDFYFGRTLDYETSYGEEVTVTPRSCPFRFRREGALERHYAMIGMVHPGLSAPRLCGSTPFPGIPKARASAGFFTF